MCPLQDGIGAQTQKPLVIVVIGGATTLAVVARMIQPPVARQTRREPAHPSGRAHTGRPASTHAWEMPVAST